MMEQPYIIPDTFRLCLYIAMGVLPIWQDFFTKSTDYTFRGLAMPIISSLMAIVTITLAKTSTKRDQQKPVEVVAPKGNPLEVTETAPISTQQSEAPPHAK